MTNSSDAQQPLDELMMAMDVVDTLRHRDGIVARELGADQRDSQLLERLREIYASQGIDVPDRILEQGVAALREDRFTFTPPEGGLEVWLARLYVSRAVWGKWAAGLILVAIIGWAGWYFAVERPREAAIEAQRIELTRTLPDRMEQIGRRVQAATAAPEAVDQVGALIAQGRAAIGREDLDGARQAVDALARLESDLNATYEIRVVSGKGEKSGVWRKPKVNPDARNYYLIVEAVDANGQVIEKRIRNEETGETETVVKWGQRVTRAAYDAVAADKRDDGIIQNRIIGTKPAGVLKPIWHQSVREGAITRW